MALFNKIAVVTGAAIGIGKAITEILLKNGAKVKCFLLATSKVPLFTWTGKTFISSVCKNNWKAKQKISWKMAFPHSLHLTTLFIYNPLQLQQESVSSYCKLVLLMSLVHMQVALLDFNDSEGESLTQDLQSHYGQGRALFLSCNVESEEAFRGSPPQRRIAFTE